MDVETLARGGQTPAGVSGGAHRPDAGLLLLGPETDEAALFLRALEDQGVVLAGVAEVTSTLPLVILITDQDADEPDIPSDREVLPVTFTDEFTPVLPKLSHLTPRHEGVEVAARRLAREIRLGGATLIAWERLASRLVAWERSGSGRDLLTQNEQADAVNLMTRPAPQLGEKLMERVRAFVESSGRHSLRRRRRWRAIVTTTLVVLLAVMLVAGLQAHYATLAAREAVAATNLADARRLVTEAVRGQGLDPDTPLILALMAGQLTDDSDVRSVIAGVKGGQVPHVSIPLDSVPANIVTSDSGRYAYTSYFDSRVRVVDAAGEPVGSFAYADPEETVGARIQLAPDGQHVAVQPRDDAMRVFEVGTADNPGDAVEVGEESDTLIGWWDQTSLMVGNETGVELLDVVSGGRRTWIETETQAVTSGALSPDRRMLSITDGQQVQVWEIPGKRLMGTVELDRVTNLAVDDTGTVVFAARYPSLTRIDFNEEEATLTVDSKDRASVGIQALARGYFIASDRRGGVAIYHSAAGADALTRFQAHLDDVVRIAANPNGTSFVSVALDGYLRIWDLSELGLTGTYTIAGPVDNGVIGGVLDFNAVLDAAFPKVTFRNQIRTIADDSLAVALSTRGAALVDPVDPTATHESFGLPRVGIPGRSFVTASGRHVVRMIFEDSDNSFTAELWRIDDQGFGWGTEPVATHSVKVQTVYLGPAPLLVDVDADDTLVIGTGTELSTYRPGDEYASRNQRYPNRALPLAVAAAFDGAPSAVTDDGMLHRMGREPVDLLAVSVDLADQRITAAEFHDNSIWLLASSGAILTWSGGTVRLVVPPGLVTGLGTLRLSSDGELLAHVGATEVSILATADGSPLAQQSVPIGIGIDDVSFGSGNDILHVINEQGAVASWELAEFSARATAEAPRLLTDEEILAFGVREVSHG